MKRFPFLLFAFLFLTSAIAHAQTVVGPNSTSAWDVAVADAATPAAAAALTYKMYEGSTPTTLTGVTCVVGATGFQTCQAKLPAFSAGIHTVTLTATNVVGESPKSAPASFNMVLAAPGAPVNFRQVP
jgi:hypothetical protein